VEADAGAVGDDHVLVDDGAAHDRPSADLHVVHEHRVLDERVRVQHHAGGEDGTPGRTAGDDHAGGDERVDRAAHPVPVVVHELRRGKRVVAGVDRPLRVVQVEDRVDRDEVHV